MGGQMDIDGKCLYLEVDDCRQDVGTTVIVCDVFYNQPVRRKQMHFNPENVLHSLKDPLLQIIDIESEDDLCCTHASPSPLPLLTSEFGIHLSSLNKLNASDGSFKLSGYISGPDVYTVKRHQNTAIQMICLLSQQALALKERL